MLEFVSNKVAGFQSPVCDFIKKESPVQVFFCEFLGNFKNAFCTEQLRVTDCLCNFNISVVRLLSYYRLFTILLYFPNTLPSSMNLVSLETILNSLSLVKYLKNIETIFGSDTKFIEFGKVFEK